jgi:hypothetical protein
LPGTSGFTGRVEQLAVLDAALPDTSAAAGAVVVVSGPGGVGKTALAVHWAHGRRDRFPDGQLFANLYGFDPADRPVPANEVVHGFLLALGVPAGRIPEPTSARTALFRSLLADRSKLVVLDNAVDADQVRPLLLGAASCVTVVTMVCRGRRAAPRHSCVVAHSQDTLSGVIR